MAQILVVDNEERMCKVIKAGLEFEDHTVDLAFSGAEALDCLGQNKKYDLVITDLKMQQIDGLQVLRAAKKLRESPEVILITAFASQNTAIEAMRLGAYDYLIKPFEMDELIMRINRIIEQKQIHEENIQLREELGSFHNSKGENFISLLLDSIFGITFLN